jgi:hypothetical protein
MRWASAAGLACLALEACRGGGAGAGTGLYVTARFDGIAADQLELSVSGPQGGTMIVPATLRPAQATAPLTSPQTVAIYLSDDLDGAAVTCAAGALAGGQRLDDGASAGAVVRRGQLVAVDLALAPITRKPIGAACAGAEECDSALCVDGVCCASACDGLCTSCKVAGSEGTCVPVPPGTRTDRCADQGAPSCGFDGTCDGSGGCRRYPIGVLCAPAACAAGTLTPASACDGQGSCVPARTVDCAPYACADGDPPACRSACATDADCVSGRTCSAGSCGARPKQPNGAGCQDASTCASAFCEDGVCCDTSCAGACASCNVAGAAGTCTPVPAGKTDPRGRCTDGGVASCGQNGLCDGKGGCALYPSGAACAAGTCVARFLIGARRCDGKGTCQAAAMADCAPYTCDAGAHACFSSCTSGAQCATAAARSCTMGTCQ